MGAYDNYCVVADYKDSKEKFGKTEKALYDSAVKDYNSEKKQSICSCDIKSILLSSSEIHNKDDLFLTEFSNSEESSSTSALKCASTLFSKDGIKKNIAFYIYLVLFIAISISGIQFYRKGFNSLMKSINQILIEKEKKNRRRISKIR